MPTAAELFRDIGEEIGDPANAKYPQWKLMLWINKAIKQAVKDTNCLWATISLQGQRLITIISTSALAGDTITLVVSGTTSIKTIATATQAGITALLNTVTGVKAYSSGTDKIYVLGIDGYEITSMTTNAGASELTIGDDGYETFDLSSILTAFRRVTAIYDATNDKLYQPLSRALYDRVLIDSDYEGYGYFVSPDGLMYLKAYGANATSATSFGINYLQFASEITLASSELPGPLNDHEGIIRAWVKQHYHYLQGDYQSMGLCYSIYKQLTADLRRQMRSQGEPLVMRHFYRWH